MKKIHILSSAFTNPNSCAFLFPLIYFQKTLNEAGYAFRFFYSKKNIAALTDCDFLLIEHKALTKDWDPERSLEFLAQLKEQTRIIWCDQSDSSGTFLSQVLPYVDKYLKAQTYQDLENYQRNYYADRIYTDYYHKEYGITDELSYDYQPAKTKADLNKIGLSWNSGLMNHGYWGPYLMRLKQYFPFGPSLLHFAKPPCSSSNPRSIDISCRMGISYERQTVCFQRQEIKKKLSHYIKTNKLSRRQYFHEMMDSKICISPFGLGEITLKDFECFLTGSLLLKPSMKHMHTWPNFYEEDITYISHDWDLDNLNEQIDIILQNNAKRIEISQEAQSRYLRYTHDREASKLFASHFQTIFDELGQAKESVQTVS